MSRTITTGRQSRRRVLDAWRHLTPNAGLRSTGIKRQRVTTNLHEFTRIVCFLLVFISEDSWFSSDRYDYRRKRHDPHLGGAGEEAGGNRTTGSTPRLGANATRLERWL